MESKLILNSDVVSIDLNIEDTIKLYNLYYSKLEDVIDIDLNKLKSFLKSYYEIHASIKI